MISVRDRREESKGLEAVWRRLGGGELRLEDGRSARGQAFWRGSSDWNIHLDLERDLWRDYAHESHREFGGTTLGLIRVVTGLDSREAWRWLYGDRSPPRSTEDRRQEKEDAKEVYPYYAATGEKVFEIHRWDGERGRKRIRPYLPGTREWKHHPGPRPLYQLLRLLSDRALPVLVVEGEKVVEKIQGRLDGYVVTTWSGGSSVGHIRKTDWTLLKGRRIVLSPDADEPGEKAMKEVERLAGASETGWIRHEGCRKGFDLGDVGESVDLEGWIAERLSRAEPEPYAEPIARWWVEKRQGRVARDERRWYYWTGMKWEVDRTYRLFNEMREEVRGLRDRLRDGRRSYASLANGRVTHMVERLCSLDSRICVPSEGWNQDRWLTWDAWGNV